MNKQEKLFFEALSKDRAESANFLEKPSIRNIKESVVEKYSDQAHFIYELLQNANDAKATRARFILEPSRLIFAHNGTRHFSISDPMQEDEDSHMGKLGDVNAITSIANSNKTGSSIGKFGVGFKAVFQYTSTPEIYDPSFCFKIERFIVPTLLEEDFPARQPDETLFIFPFNLPYQNKEKSYEDILNKLQNLSYPLLLLSDLQEIEFEFENEIGFYSKSLTETHLFGKTTAEHIKLTQGITSNEKDQIESEFLWLFSQVNEEYYRYSVGFFLDQEGHLRPTTQPAFCFFPTKETTNLKFIVHAPFLLTDSREGIRASESHNHKMIQCLADLAAQSLLHLKKISQDQPIQLIDDNILQIIPYNPEVFSSLKDKSKISFLPFYQSIQKVFQSEEILPTRDGYISAANAYWASTSNLSKLFDNEQLRELSNDKNRSWVFTSKSREALKEGNMSFVHYIDQLGIKSLTDMDLILGWSDGIGITEQFIENQTLEWLEQFYKWINASTNRRHVIEDKPIFLNQNRKAVAAFKGTTSNLFLPRDNENIEDYNLVFPPLLEKEEAVKLIQALGITSPSRHDYIYSILIPSYEKSYWHEPITYSHFKILFNYYCESSNQEAEQLINKINELFYWEYENSYSSRESKANEMYLPIADLKKFFAPTEDIKFINFQTYLNVVGKKREKQLITFFEKLGVKKEPKIRNYSYRETGYYEEEFWVEGLENLIEDVERKRDLSYSEFLWNILGSFIEKGILSSEVLNLKIGKHKEGQRSLEYSYGTPSPTLVALKTKKWLTNSQGKWVTAQDLTKDKLNSIYNLESRGANSLISHLGIKDSDDWNLTQEQRRKIELANLIEKELGSTEIIEDVINDFIEFQKSKNKSLKRQEKTTKSTLSSYPHTQSFQEMIDSVLDLNQEQSISSKKKKGISDILPESEDFLNPISSIEENDQDEYLPAPIDYGKRIQRAKEKSATKVNQIVYLEELYKKAKTKERYSFGWFKVLLELEKLKSLEENRNQKEFSIRFAKVERQSNTKQTLILKDPNRPIPQFIEDLGDLTLVLQINDLKKTIPIEVSNIQSYTLRVKIKKNVELENIDFSSVKEASIEVKSPLFLLEKLQEALEALPYDDDFNMRQNLPSNIQFIFGPPGTGKTTHLAKEICLPLMREKASCKVLVLTPTNKASDVLTSKIIECCEKDNRYEDWLIRFGSTANEDIEKSSIFVDKELDPRRVSHLITITTISRFPYDFFLFRGQSFFLKEIAWDYIIVDEASMIPLVNLIYLLYKTTPKRFIIAGDPFQIEPITAVDLWKTENIYTLVELKSFQSPNTRPKKYEVKKLKTQYRSVDEIGNLFSQFAYNGHLRNSSHHPKLLHLKEGPTIKSLNLIKFPVSKYESIYRAKILQHGSPYHIYSALFVYEYVSYLAHLIARSTPRRSFKIGIIAPYRAQADLIDKLLATRTFPQEIEIQVGTIHRFQGDECDMVFVVFNPPTNLSSSKNMFLNNPNIINVAISRARDYLFILMPDENTENLTKLTQLKQLENLIKKSNSWIEYSTAELETLMFGTSKFLEDNSFSTSHQEVNVYSRPEKIYEVRTEDNAIDLQIHQEIVDIPQEEDRLLVNVVFRNQKIGQYSVVDYEGKVKDYSNEKLQDMYIFPSQKYQEKKKFIPVSVDSKNKIIFVSKYFFKFYEEDFIHASFITLYKTKSGS